MRPIHASALISPRFSSFRRTSALRGSAHGVTRERERERERERVTLPRSWNDSLQGDRGSLSRGRVVYSLLPLCLAKSAKGEVDSPDARSFVIFNYGRDRGEDCLATLDRGGTPFFAGRFYFFPCYFDREGQRGLRIESILIRS